MYQYGSEVWWIHNYTFFNCFSQNFVRETLVCQHLPGNGIAEVQLRECLEDLLLAERKEASVCILYGHRKRNVYEILAESVQSSFPDCFILLPLPLDKNKEEY